MKDYSDNSPRLFATICLLDRVADQISEFILVYIYKWTLYLLALIELRLCVLEYHALTATGRIVIPIAFPLYIIAFHACAEPEFRAKFFALLSRCRSYLQRYFSKN